MNREMNRRQFPATMTLDAGDPARHRRGHFFGFSVPLFVDVFTLRWSFFLRLELLLVVVALVVVLCVSVRLAPGSCFWFCFIKGERFCVWFCGFVLCFFACIVLFCGFVNVYVVFSGFVRVICLVI